MHDEKLVKGMVQERIGRLLSLAYERTGSEKEPDALSKRYVKLAREMSSHYKVRIGRSEKHSFCKKCNSMLIPGKTCTVILASGIGKVIYKCKCGAEAGIFYK